jgi:hypothetical protein
MATLAPFGHDAVVIGHLEAGHHQVRVVAAPH